jgi:hypothetical protein
MNHQSRSENSYNTFGESAEGDERNEPQVEINRSAR